MKKALLLFVTMLLIFTGCNSNPKEEDKQEPFIEFTSEVIHVDYGSEFDPLSSNIIKDSYGDITYVDVIDTTIPGEYEFTYYAGKETDPIRAREYKIKVIVDENSSNNSGYPMSSLSYVIDRSSWDKIESRYKVDPKGTEDRVVLSITPEKEIYIMSGNTDGGEWSYWEGTYELLEGNLYQASISKKVDSSGNEENTNYEIYFYLISLNSGGELYYFTERPSGDFDTSMPHFSMYGDPQ